MRGCPLQAPQDHQLDSEPKSNSLAPKVNRFSYHTIPKESLQPVGSAGSEIEMPVEETIIQSVQIEQSEPETLVTFLKIHQEFSAAGVNVEIEKIELHESIPHDSAFTVSVGFVRVTFKLLMMFIPESTVKGVK
jgi:hypothetical protein